MRTRTLTLAAAAVVLAACTSTPDPAPATTSSTPAAKPCWDSVREGAIVTDALIEHGCIDPNGAKRFGTAKTCKNGQRLWEMDGLMGMSGKPMLPGNLKGEDGITVRALQAIACQSTS